MGRGLSQQQLDILGLACTVNAFTQGDVMCVKEGAPVPGYRIPTNDYAGPKDVTVRLAIWAVAGIRPSTGVVGGWFAGTPEYKQAKATITRAITRLTERGMLVLSPKDSTDHRWGYALTREGMSQGMPWARDVRGLDLALRLFGMRDARSIEPTFNGNIDWLRELLNRGHISHITTANGLIGDLRDHRIDLINSITDTTPADIATPITITGLSDTKRQICLPVSDNGYRSSMPGNPVTDTEVAI